MTREALAALLEEATNALADIATMADAHQAQHKAQRIYEGIRRLWHGPGPNDDAPVQTEEAF
jgi:hypothetical protein